MNDQPQAGVRADFATRFSSERQPVKTGRPKEARDRITRKFLTALADDFEQHGETAIRQLRETDVGKYIAAVGNVVPKEIELTRAVDGLDDAQLAQAIEALTDFLRSQAPPPPTVIEELHDRQH